MKKYKQEIQRIERLESIGGGSTAIVFLPDDLTAEDEKLIRENLPPIAADRIYIIHEKFAPQTLGENDTSYLDAIPSVEITAGGRVFTVKISGEVLQ